METALIAAQEQGGTVHGGGRALAERWPDAYYVNPALAEMPAQTEIVREETFAPILYVMPYDELEEAIAIQNDVPQGLSSSIFTTDVREAEAFVSAAAVTAASPTSTSARAAPRSAVRSAARRRPAAGGRPAPTPGRLTCAGPR
jgi:acyl-CoA reductase-like NAD-dependent aldehyde dehydrogenase